MNSLKTSINFLIFSCLVSINIICAQEKETQNIQDTPKQIQDSALVEDNSLSGTLYFQNGDSVTGQIINWDLESIDLKSPDFIKPVTFSCAHILNILLDDKMNTEKQDELDDLTTLILQHRNNQQGLHGVIKGSFTNIDDTHVTLNTSYAGPVKVLKKFVTKMEVDSKQGYLYTGPNSLDEWHNNNINQSWSFTNKSLISGVSAGNIAKDIQISESALISFDLSWKKDENLKLYLYSSDIKQDRSDNYYKITIEKSGRVTMHKYTSGRLRNDMDQKNNERRVKLNFANRNTLVKDELHARYEIYMSKKDGVFHIFRNGKLINTFEDKQPKSTNFGSGLHLISSNEAPIRVKNLKLSKWSGHLPSEIDKEAFTKLKGEGQRILLKNGDILLGQIGTVTDGIMKIQTLYTPINLPIVRMRSIDLTTSDIKDEPLMYANDIKCWFKDEGWIILKPISIKGDKLTAYHQAIGENEFNLKTFKRIDLNIYEESSDQPVNLDDW